VIHIFKKFPPTSRDGGRLSAGMVAVELTTSLSTLDLQLWVVLFKLELTGGFGSKAAKNLFFFK
jgi:hypothetical protein